MSRHHLIDQRAPHDAGDPATIAGDDHGLPPALHARVIALGPAHAPALRHLLITYPAHSPRILAAASPRMGLAAVQRAIGWANQSQAMPPMAQAPAAQPQTIDAPSGSPSTQPGTTAADGDSGAEHAPAADHGHAAEDDHAADLGPSAAPNHSPPCS
jgi:hypothetical protein